MRNLMGHPHFPQEKQWAIFFCGDMIKDGDFSL
jgi:hypothetical protein